MKNIRPIRERLGLTQQALADGIGCTQSNVAQYERGQTEPSPLRARRIVEFARRLGLAISLEHVYGDIELPGSCEPLAAGQEVAHG